MEKMLMIMCEHLPYSSEEIKSRGYKEFYALMNRAEEIIKVKEKAAKNK